MEREGTPSSREAAPGREIISPATGARARARAKPERDRENGQKHRRASRALHYVAEVGR
jgi:hypothetical protein